MSVFKCLTLLKREKNAFTDTWIKIPVSYAKVGENLRHWPPRGALRNTVGTQYPSYIHFIFLSLGFYVKQAVEWF